MARVADKVARRAGLVDAAVAVFAEKGATASVRDITRTAGVAKGTFYLYFASKDDILVAVAERMVGGVIATAEAALDGDAPAVEQLRAFIQALAGFDDIPAAAEVAELIHRPENRLLHDRLEERIVPRLMPLMEAIVVRGVEEGAFAVADPHAAAWFVLGGLRGAELAGTPTEAIPRALETGAALALRALGVEEAP